MPGMEGDPIDVDRETSFSDGEIGHRDRGEEAAIHFLAPRKRGWPLSPPN